MFRQDGSCPALLEDACAGFPYGAVTRSGPPFQTVQVPNTRATGLVRFRSPLLAESRLMSFPPATEMFQFAGFASLAYEFSQGYPFGWVAPFGDPGINDRSHLPRAFRSVPRPSSPLSAKASTRCPYLRLSATPNGKDHDPDDRHQNQGSEPLGPLSAKLRFACRGGGTLVPPGQNSPSQKTLRHCTANPPASRPSRSAEAMPPRSHNSLLYDVTSANAPRHPARDGLRGRILLRAASRFAASGTSAFQRKLRFRLSARQDGAAHGES